jgi:RNA polymerase primary sigma factor
METITLEKSPAITPLPEAPTTGEDPLSLYFKEVGQVPVLKPQEEFEMARRIEALEILLWAKILSHPQLTELLLVPVKRHIRIEGKTLDRLVQNARSVRQRPSAASRKRFEHSCALMGRRIRMEDPDQEVLEAVLERLNSIARGEVEAPVRRRIQATLGSQAFRDYHKRVSSLTTAARHARDDFVRANLRLVVALVRRYNFGHMPFHDLVQEGNIGLMKAVGRFNHRRGFRFSTYAMWWIRHAITRALADKGRLVRVPVHLVSSYQKVVRAQRELSNRLGRNPTSDEISCYTELDKDKVGALTAGLPSHSFSLDTELNEGDSRRFIDLVEDPESLSATERVTDEEVYQHVQQIFGELSAREADVLLQRFGLEGKQELTLREIGNKYGLSRERVRQLQEQALKKIRARLKQRNAM